MGSLFVHCLAENAAMRHMARKAGMRQIRHGGEVDAWLDLSPGDVATFAEACAQDQVALFDFTLKSQLLAARSSWGRCMGYRADSPRNRAEHHIGLKPCGRRPLMC